MRESLIIINESVLNDEMTILQFIESFNEVNLDHFLKTASPAFKAFFGKMFKSKEFSTILVCKSKEPIHFEIQTLDLDQLSLTVYEKFPNVLPVLYFYNDIHVQQVFNSDTDGSIGFFTEGSLFAKNMIVGGQCIVVSQDLKVSELFWGDYNHGYLSVGRKMSAEVFLATDEYGYDHENLDLSSDYIFSDILEEQDTEDYDLFKIQSVLETKFLSNLKDAIEPTGWNDYLDRQSMIGALKQNERLIRRNIEFLTRNDFHKKRLQEIPQIFNLQPIQSDESLQQHAVNVEKVFQILQDVHFDRSMLEYQNFYVYISPHQVEKYLKEPSLEFVNVVFTEKETTEQFVFSFEPQEDGKPFACNLMWRGVAEGTFRNLLDGSQKKKLAAFSVFWIQLLTDLNYGLYFWNKLTLLISKKSFESILNLPVVQSKYPDYMQEDMGFWKGRNYFTFNIEGLNESSPLISVAREIGDSDFERFYFWLRKTDEKRSFSFDYCSSQDDKKNDRFSGSKTFVCLFDWKILQDAVDLWPQIAPAAIEENYSYLGDLEHVEREKSRADDRRNKIYKKPFDSLMHQGIHFRLLTIQEADLEISSLRTSSEQKIFQVFDDPYHFNLERENSFFLSADKPIDCESFLINKEIEHQGTTLQVLGYIFQSDLNAQYSVMALDFVASPILVVKGQLNTKNLYFASGLHYVQDRLECESLLACHNVGFGELHVKGSIRAKVIFSKGFGFYFEQFEAVDALCKSDHRKTYMIQARLATADGELVQQELVFPATHQVSEVVLDRYNRFFDPKNLVVSTEGEIWQKMAAGDSMIDTKKLSQLITPQYFRNAFEKLESIFSLLYPIVASDLASGGPKFRIIDKDEVTHKLDIRFEKTASGTPTILCSLSQLDQITKICYRVSQDQVSKEMTLFLEYLDQDGEARMLWSGDFESQIMELQSVRRAVMETGLFLKKEFLNTDLTDGDFKELWSKWITSLKEWVPENNRFFNLTVGISDSEVQSTQPKDGPAIPQLLIDFYKVQDVQYNGAASPFCFSINDTTYDLLPFRHIITEWEKIDDLQVVESEEATDQPSQKINFQNYANPKWIPFAESKEGDYLLFDTDPGPDGIFGQIIELQNESWSREVVASSIFELIQNQCQLLNDGKIGYLDFVLGKT